MRDAFGGAFMIKLFLVFIIIYVSFTALALNYAKAFKVKNKIIEYIKTNETVDFSNMTAAELMNMQSFFDNEIHGNMNYFATLNCSGSEIYCQNGIKIEEKGSATNTAGKYYRVTTAFGWNINFFNVISALDNKQNQAPIGLWQISGETRLIIHE